MMGLKYFLTAAAGEGNADAFSEEEKHKVDKVGWMEVLKELQASGGLSSNRMAGHTGPPSKTAAK